MKRFHVWLLISTSWARLWSLWNWMLMSPPKILCWNPNPKCGIRGWGLWEGILLWECYCLLTKSCLTLCDSMECSLPRFLYPWDFPGKNTGVGCHFLLQGIFPTYRLNPVLLGSIVGRLFTTDLPGKPPQPPKFCVEISTLNVIYWGLGTLGGSSAMMVWPSLNGLVPLYEKDTREFLSLFLPCENTRRSQSSAIQKRVLTRIELWWHPGLRTSSLQNWEINFSC